MTHVEHHREQDGELVGYLRTSGVDDLVEPVTLLGHSLGEPRDRDEAAELLDACGLAALNVSWWVRAPEPLHTGTDLRRPGTDWGWRRFEIVEVSPGRASVRPVDGDEHEATVTVTLPATDVLHPKPPST